VAKSKVVINTLPVPTIRATNQATLPSKGGLGPQSVHEFDRRTLDRDLYADGHCSLQITLIAPTSIPPTKPSERSTSSKGAAAAEGGDYKLRLGIQSRTPGPNTWFSMSNDHASERERLLFSRIIDYNNYGQTFNSIAQEIAELRVPALIRTFNHNGNGSMSYSWS